ncbi:hypothetical protein [Corynebacterium lubricantis]|uniref:hypothetical protein n=1 Tax=Corynebacterium lubricantis TaxID=541095 RepID=UPI00036B0140|nr:hypothetical protein [Corynebacterium lubricantis]
MHYPEGVIEIRLDHNADHEIDEEYATRLIEETQSFARRFPTQQIHVVGTTEAMPVLAIALSMQDDISDNVVLVEHGHECSEHRIVVSADYILDGTSVLV